MQTTNNLPKKWNQHSGEWDTIYPSFYTYPELLFIRGKGERLPVNNKIAKKFKRTGKVICNLATWAIQIEQVKIENELCDLYLTQMGKFLIQYGSDL